MGAGRDRVNPNAGRDCAAAVYKEAGITDPLNEIDCAEIYVPFSWFEPMWLENLGFAEEGTGWKMVHDGSHRARRPAADQHVAAACCRPTRSAPPG